MKANWRRFMTSMALAGCVAMVGSACVVTAKGRVRTRPAVVVDAENPPPKPKYQRVSTRPGHVWVRGHWEWRGNRWVWKTGHWEKSRVGYSWVPGHWEKRGGQYHWVAGRWEASGSGGGDVVVRDHRKPKAPAYPTTAPPARRAETPGTRAGYVWVSGRWDWKGGKWTWTAGHWERAQSGKTWKPGHWERRGDRYVWVDGSWIVSAAGGGGGGVVVRDHRKPKVLPYPTSAPPAPRHKKNPGVRAGHVWIQGHWEWRGGKWVWKVGHWKKAKHNHQWVPGHWEHKGDRYVWVDGRWEAGVKVRDHRKKKADEPTPKKNERVKSRRAR